MHVGHLGPVPGKELQQVEARLADHLREQVRFVLQEFKTSISPTPTPHSSLVCLTWSILKLILVMKSPMVPPSNTGSRVRSETSLPSGAARHSRHTFGKSASLKTGIFRLMSYVKSCSLIGICVCFGLLTVQSSSRLMIEVLSKTVGFVYIDCTEFSRH